MNAKYHWYKNDDPYDKVDIEWYDIYYDYESVVKQGTTNEELT